MPAQRAGTRPAPTVAAPGRLPHYVSKPSPKGKKDQSVWYSQFVSSVEMKTNCVKHYLLTALLTLPATSNLYGHDFWIRPARFLVEPDNLLNVRLLVGDHLQGSPLRRDPAHIKEFVVVGPRGRENVPGRDGADPAGWLRLPERGSYVVGYSSHPNTLTLPAQKFQNYLEEESLHHILALRAERGESSSEGVEAFSRSVKALVVCGNTDQLPGDRILGLELELLAEEHPAGLTPGSAVPVKILYRGLPLADHPLRAVWEEDPEVSIRQRTDERGRAVFELPAPGVWVIRTVHMIEADGNQEFDWESFWATLTFELPKIPGS